MLIFLKQKNNFVEKNHECKKGRLEFNKNIKEAKLKLKKNKFDGFGPNLNPPQITFLYTALFFFSDR